jgi:hypothetical protein
MVHARPGGGVVTSARSPQGLRLSSRPGTALAPAHEVPVDARRIWFLEACGQTVEQRPPLALGHRGFGEVARADDRELAHLPRARQASWQVRRGCAQSPAEFGVLDHLNARMS